MQILFVCVANICRSPALAFLFQKGIKKEGVASQFSCSSAAISSWSVGDGVSPMIKKWLKEEGIDSEHHRARSFKKEDFQKFDYILAVNEDVLKTLILLTTSEIDKSKVFLATHFSPSFFDQEIADPYKKEEKEQKKVFKMIQTVVTETIESLKK